MCTRIIRIEGHLQMNKINMYNTVEKLEIANLQENMFKMNNNHSSIL